MRTVLSIWVLLLAGWSLGQPYGNEWIQYDQNYYRISIYQDGIHRISHQTMIDAGIPVDQLASEQYQLFGRETEIPVYISDGGDGLIDPGDYIEFFGEKNDGWLDSLLYTDPGKMGNPHYSLVNDTINYFLSWSGNGNNSRIQEETNTDFQNYLDPSFIRRTVRVVKSNQYNFGQLLAFNNNIPDYVEGEGWMGGRFGVGTSSLDQTVVLNTSNAYTFGSANAIGKTVYSSASNASTGGNNHHIKIYRGPANNLQLEDLVFSGYQLNSTTFGIGPGQMLDETVINHVVVDDLDVPSDQFRISYTEITYSHTKDISDLDVLDFVVAANPTQDKYHLDLIGNSIATPVIYSIGQQTYRCTGVVADEALDFLVPDQGQGASRIFIVDESSVIDVPIEKVTSTGQYTDYSSLSPDSAFVIIYHPILADAAQTYATYRTNTSRDAVLIDIEELYDQYGGGIPKHFISIRRFCDMALNSWSSRPAHLFLLGKSVFFEQQNNLNGTRKNPELYSQCLIPSFGSPGSDLLFTSGLEGPAITPSIPTGRLSAFNNTEVLDYLDKVVYNESRDPAAWMKNVLHFGGGSTEFEQDRFAGYLEDYEEIIEDTCFGGNVSTFLKTSSLPIVVNLSDSISGIIEEGVSILTFFGHAGGGQFDQSIDDPQNLEWGAHPMVIVNSCFSGDIHQPGHISTSEQYVVLADKGAIGFVASVQQGNEGYLNAYSRELYTQISQKNYSRSIGYMIQQTIDTLYNAGFNQGDARASLLMNLLEGDPATPIFSPASPDLSISSSSISFAPQEIDALVDSIEISVVVTNIGKGTNKPFDVALQRTLPDGAEINYNESLNGLKFRDTVRFNIPTDFSNGFGINTFEVQVDLPNNVVSELDNFINNRASRTLPITDGGVFPVIPYEFAIIPDVQVTLKASTGNPFIEERDYRIQLDSTDLFNSSLLLEYQTSQSGGVISWEVPLTLTDSSVYYWRVAEIPEDPNEISWRESSFQHIEDRSGWGQSHFFQFKKDQFNNLIYDRPEREFEFLSGTKLLSCEVFGNSFSLAESSEYFIDFQSAEYNGCGITEAFHVAVIDPITLEPWGTRYNGENPDHDFGNVNDNGACRSRVENYFIFRQNNESQLAGFQNMIENEIPDGHYVLIYSWLHARPAWWPTYLPEIPDIFTELGASQIPLIDADLPFIFIAVKGDPSQSIEIVGDTLNSHIELDFPMPVTGNSGSLGSAIIGPAQSWSSLYWKGKRISSSDSANVKLIGITSQGVEQEISAGNFDISVEEVLQLDQLIDASIYPYIRLKADFYDPIELDPVQMDRWQILYEPVPEAALNPILAFSFHNDTIQEGEQIELTSAIENISDLDMDSLLVRYWIQTQDNQIIEIPYQRQDSLRSGESLIDTIQFNSFGLSGKNTFWVEANPVNISTGEYDQLEQYHFNNLGQLRFLVNQDRINPILDVTFDGVHILDGDLISAKPEILVRLDDENPFLLMDQATDTAYFSLFVTDPIGTQKRMYFSDGQGNELINFIPASAQSNISDIILRPDLEFDGEYKLLVIASDKSGNSSGDVNYRIGFEVDHSSSITEVLNYPNPFSTSTRFVFTLTGSKVPDQMKIQIMTVTGRVVREIFKEELGNIKIGRNITDFAWDGTDQYGDRLANGVYLYRVIVKDGGDDVDVRATAASTFFKKGFGKMYLLR